MGTRMFGEAEKDQVLAVVKRYMSQELRQKIMLEAPQAYNAWMGGEYVRVHRVVDGTAIVPGVIPVTHVVFETEDQMLLRLAAKMAADDEALPEIQRNGLRIWYRLKQSLATGDIQFLRNNKEEILEMARTRKLIE